VAHRTSGPAGRLVVRIGPADVGRRVTVRHRVSPGEGTLTDVVGVLDAWTGGSDGVLSVRRRDGRVERVPAADMVAARVIAPEVSAEQMQLIAQAGWPATQTARLGDWELRWAGGGSGRANSVRVAGSPGRPLDRALAEVEAWYRDRGGAARLQVPWPSLSDAAFDALGWPEVRRTYVLTAGVPNLLGVTAATAGRAGLTATVDAQPSDEWLAAVGDRDTDDDALLRRILTSPVDVGFASLRTSDGALVGIGRVSASSGWAGVTSVEAATTARRIGVATSVMHALARWAQDRRIPRLYLQVFATNAGALALYDRLGFVRHHAYVYRANSPLPS
jgi:N-acetylglutamate synthase